MAKIGDGHVAAMGRLGLKELRNALNPSRESVAADEMGLYGALTPQEVSSAREDQGAVSLESLRETAKDIPQTEGHGLPDQGRKQGGIER